MMDLLGKSLRLLGYQFIRGKRGIALNDPLDLWCTLFVQIQDLISFIRRKRIQVMHAHMNPANQLGVVVGKLSRIPVFPTVHTPAAFVDKRSSWDLRVYFKKAVNQFVYRAADRVLVVSQEIKEIVQQRFGLKDN